MGLLRIKGSIDLNQFWPTGKSPNILSDADTVHVQVDPATSFVFEGDVTHAFDFAWVTTRKNKDGSRSPNYVIVSQQTPNARIKVRLQGVDAPELHYHVDQQKPEVRQLWGKKTTFELRKFLISHAQNMTIDCYVETFVPSPNEVCDAYGRVVGDIIIATDKGFVNVNHWLVQEGWAFPTHYNSMRIGEINAINAAWASSKSGIRKSIVNRATPGMHKLPAGKAGDKASDAKRDTGPVVMPKLFRRLVGFMENPKGTITLESFLALPSKKRDLVIDLAIFKTLTPAQRVHPTKKGGGVPLIKFHTLVKDGNRLDHKLEDLVFVEDPADLKNSTGKVTGWGEQGSPVARI